MYNCIIGQPGTAEVDTISKKILEYALTGKDQIVMELREMQAATNAELQLIPGKVHQSHIHLKAGG